MALIPKGFDLLRLKTIALVKALDLYEPTPAGRQPEMGNALLARLGCPYLTSVGTIRWPDLAPADAEAAQDCIVELLAAFVRARSEMQESDSDAISVLASLITHGWWRSCLESESGSHILAAAVLNYVEFHSPDVELSHATQPVVLEMLNAWVRPVKPWTEIPLGGIVAGHLFGEQWPSFALPDSCFDPDADYADTRVLASLIVLRDRPPFLPGLCHAAGAVQDIKLPDLGYPG